MLQDLAGKAQGHGFTGANKQQNLARLRDFANRWFFDKDCQSDFEAWCDMSGFEPEYVREKAREVYENGLPSWRAAPGKGVRYEYRKKYHERNGP
ncbi:hypothetical protein FRUB_04240 [Fimbriiglobus ruber]|uniref:Uncharacterized protein n=2 Tax=Fimbriiglobus ruber TaxID=1908690 RepID=A0A225DL70_9BACT|nr:hypothetical protein FRUB_04240 [Fimbriiglobus ruber]